MALEKIATKLVVGDVLKIVDIGDIDPGHLSAEEGFWRTPSVTQLHSTLAPFLMDCLDTISRTRTERRKPKEEAQKMALAGLAMGRFVRVTGMIDEESSEAQSADLENVLFDSSPRDSILQIHVPRTLMRLYAPTLDTTTLPFWLTSNEGLYAEVLQSAKAATPQFYEEHAIAFNAPFDPASGVMVRPYLSRTVFSAPPIV